MRSPEGYLRFHRPGTGFLQTRGVSKNQLGIANTEESETEPQDIGKVIETKDLPETGEREAEVKRGMEIEKTFPRSIR